MKNEVNDLIMLDRAYGTKLTVADNQDPYMEELVMIETEGAIALTLEQVDELIAKMLEICGKYK